VLILFFDSGQSLAALGGFFMVSDVLYLPGRECCEATHER
jgi:hypothetical protein